MNCGARIVSDPTPITLSGKVHFSFIIEIPENDFCDPWIAQDTVVVDVEGEVAAQLARCNIDVPCLANPRLACSDNHTDAEYRWVTFMIVDGLGVHYVVHNVSHFLST